MERHSGLNSPTWLLILLFVICVLLELVFVPFLMVMVSILSLAPTTFLNSLPGLLSASSQLAGVVSGSSLIDSGCTNELCSFPLQHCCHRTNVRLGCQEAQELQEGVQGLPSQQNIHVSLHCLVEWVCILFMSRNKATQFLYTVQVDSVRMMRSNEAFLGYWLGICSCLLVIRFYDAQYWAF